MRVPSSRTWARLDNASNIFLAARNAVDTKVFRLTADLRAPVEPHLLQRALDATFARYPLYSSVLRKGLFWYHLQSSALRPVAAPDTLPVCAPLYRPDRPTLLFRVVYYRSRISLEVFHALSDGTGALWFLQDLLSAYAALRAPAADSATSAGQLPAQVHTLSPDSFSHYFKRQKRASRQATDQEPASAQEPASEQKRASEQASARAVARRGRRVRVFRIKGTYTPDLRTHLVELTLPTAKVLNLARAEGVSMTMYLVAVFFDSVRAAAGGAAALGRAPAFGVSVPVNLRGHFPSTSARNFFATVQLEHTYGVGADDVGSVARALEADFRAQIEPDELEAKVRRFVRFERMLGLRVVPRPIKDWVLSLINRANNRRITVAISNLGRVQLPQPAEEHVGAMGLSVSAVRPQLSVISHGENVTLNFTSPFVEVGHVREAARFFSRQGIPVRVLATAVTEEDLGGAES
ncbi:MAG: alcohol acetyltransferase [Galactobacter sp.]